MDQPAPDLQLARVLLELSRDTTSTLILQEVLDKSLVALRQLLDFGGGAIQLLEDGHLVAAATDPPATSEARAVRIPVGQGVSGQIALTGEPCYIADIAVDPRVHPDGRARGISTGVHSYFGVPLILHGTSIGVVQFDAPNVDAFTPEARALVLAFVPTIAAAVQNAQLFEREAAMLAELLEVQRMRTDFAAVVSHELRTPLTKVIGFAELLEARCDDLPAAQVRDYAQRILTGSRDLGTLIETLFELSLLESGRLPVQVEPTAVTALLQQVVSEADVGTHALQLDAPPGLPPVLIDARRLRQILVNLITNAHEYSPPGTTIVVRARAVEDGVAVTIEDQGRGIPRDLHERVFERFFQVEHPEMRTSGGLGIGLFLVRQLCEQIGASITLDSEPGRGSCFSLHLPTHADAPVGDRALAG